ncbi:transposase family protein [Streptomyces europaeiscabiei]|uniref:transposase family protein n=1 Tax=Streptomyces europaeiscabiei TaxID=146819 RepID=UPI002E17642E
MTVSADASFLIPPALDQLRENPQVGPEEVPSLLERPAETPDPSDPRGVRHCLAVVLAHTACAVPAGATSLLAVGEWIADAPHWTIEALYHGSDTTFTEDTSPLRTQRASRDGHLAQPRRRSPPGGRTEGIAAGLHRAAHAPTTPRTPLPCMITKRASPDYAEALKGVALY